MMNPGHEKAAGLLRRQQHADGVIDGEKKMVGGGSRGMAEGKFKEYRAEIDARLGEAPAVVLKARASRAGDVVKVDYAFDKAVPRAEYNIVLVQRRGEIQAAPTASCSTSWSSATSRRSIRPRAKQASFDLAASEQAADAYLTDFEKTSDRFPNFKFPERHAKIDRAKLRVVFFAQDKETKKVLNALVADVK